MTFDVAFNAPDHWVFTGNMNVDALEAQAKALEEAMPTSGSWCLDFSSVHAMSTAALSMLFFFIRHAEAHNLPIQLVGFPQNVRDLMRAHGVLALFERYEAPVST